MSLPRNSGDSASSKSQSLISSSEASANPKFSDSEFSEEERAQLLLLAHESILSELEGRQIPLDSPTPHLAEPRGVFTSLYLHGELRGCIGYVLPIHPLYRTVAETARAAAFGDTRFASVTRDEASHLQIELSVLSVPQPIAAEAIRIGRHGLVISMAGHRGLLLPQVATEHHWDRETFLEQTCRKAGLPNDAWKNLAPDGGKLEAFTAEIFGENKMG
jgi:AmmeMemoRadiSam system protein A